MTVHLRAYPEARLAAQPIGYWSDLTARLVLAAIRGELAEEGLTQPHWWTLNHVAGATADWERTALAAKLAPYATGHLPAVDFDRVFDDLRDRGWLAESADGGALVLTEAGEAGRQRARERLAAAHERIHDGIPAADRAAALDVLRRMVANLGGDADLPS
ncbi:MarR family transcriptional regulator [Kitasatospora sp. RG8]|uniref:MarR family winged helix-turn-helix transcriptional regulator n=1 Tax=Kitasatospora sp. RG8 TaxID=2820815 RepID=UPI001AE01C53|nr:MarR family transcriptional regulator [Kitasatospora sp. RG8]MBP0448308.1 MarR family transcriptional regulator [Kitasatospora sp. RG8]